MAKYLIWLVFTLLLAFFVKNYCFSVFLIPSNSMSPALEIGDRVLCNKLKKSNFTVGDVIIFWKPPQENSAKESSYVMAKRITKIENKDYFVQGDNTNNSRDSRTWGLVNDSLVIGKAEFIVWSDWDDSKKPIDRTFVWNRFLKPIIPLK